MTGPLFECAFSVDELAVLADLLEVPSLPGGDPEADFSRDAKAAACRGLLARGVVVTDEEAGSVEISQPFATVISLLLTAEEADVLPDGRKVFRSGSAEVTVAAQANGTAVWRVASRSATAEGNEGMHATVAGEKLTFRGG